jgi:peptidoglycan/LPS O-acetylase OafA/YrhL
MFTGVVRVVFIKRQNMKKTDEKLLKEYMPGLDGLRAVAVSAVIIFHMNSTAFWHGGFSGVDVFFVISGYVISKTLASRFDKNPVDFFLGFYKRRLTRIMPMLLVMLIAVTVASVLFIPSSWLSNTIDSTGLSAFFGCSNFILAGNNDGYFSPKTDLNPFLHTWSLAVEEQFYVIFPLIFYFMIGLRKVSSREESRLFFRNLPFMILLVLSASSFAFSILETSGDPLKAYYLLPGRFWELASGAILYELHERGFFVSAGRIRSDIFTGAGFALVMAGFVAADESGVPFPWALLPVTGTLLMICGVGKCASPDAVFVRIFSSKVMTYIGKISYSLYLWHWPVSALFRWTFGFDSFMSKALYVIVSFALAVISYHFVEDPFRKSRLIKGMKNPIAVPVLLSAMLLCFLIAFGLTSFKSDLSLSVTRNGYVWQSGIYANDGPKKPILVDADINGRQIFAAGDSHTAAYRTMLNIVSKELGLKVRTYERGDCPVAGLLKPMNRETRAHYEKTLNEIRGMIKPGDVVFLASLRMPEFADLFQSSDVDRIADVFFCGQAVENRRLALEEADEVVNEFTKLGAYVVMEAPLPVLLSPPYRCSDWFNRMNPVGTNGLTVRRDFLDKVRRPVMESISILKKRHRNFFVWDPFPVLCTGDVFSAFDSQGKPIFWDGDHLSGNGNRLLVPSFRKFLVSLWDKP